MSPETIYGQSGDCREELNAGMAPGNKGYKDEAAIKGAIITRSLRRATRVINGKLEPVYPGQIPFTGTVPVLIDTIADDLAVCYVQRSKHPGPGPMTADVKDEYCERAMELLDKLADREMELPELTSTINYTKTFHTREDRTPVFDMDDVENQGVDPDLLDDISDARD